MRNVAANLSPDLLGLLLQSSSLARAKAGQATSELEAFQTNGNGGEGPDKLIDNLKDNLGEGFGDILSMLTFGQAQGQNQDEVGQINNDNNDKIAIPNSDNALAEILASIDFSQAQTSAPAWPIQKNIARMERELRPANNVQDVKGAEVQGVEAQGMANTGVSRMRSPILQDSGVDLQTILTQARPKVAMTMTNSAQTRSMVESSATAPIEEDAMEMSLLKRDVEQSPIVPGKLTAKTKGLLTGSDFVGLKTGFEQNQLESGRQSTLDMKRPIPALYQAEQNKMMNSAASKKQNGSDDGHLILANKSVEMPLAAGSAFEKDLNVQRFENGLKSVNMKGHVDLKTGPSLDTKVQDVVGKISDYIVQAKFDKNNSLDVTLRHNDLGQFQMKVSKAVDGPGLDIMIRPHSMESQRFFADNQQSLVKNLGESGLKILDFKISSPFTSSFSGNQVFGEGKSDNSNSGFAGTRQDSHNFQSNSNNNEQHDSERRRQLWEQARERLERQYA